MQRKKPAKKMAKIYARREKKLIKKTAITDYPTELRIYEQRRDRLVSKGAFLGALKLALWYRDRAAAEKIIRLTKNNPKLYVHCQRLFWDTYSTNVV